MAGAEKVWALRAELRESRETEAVAIANQERLICQLSQLKEQYDFHVMTLKPEEATSFENLRLSNESDRHGHRHAREVAD